MPMMNLVAGFLLNFNFRGSDDSGVLFGGDRGKVYAGSAPAFVAEGSTGRWLRRDVADELDEIGVRAGRFRVSTLDAVDDRGEADVARNGIAALVVEFPDGGADLIVRVAGDVLHQKIDQPGIALKDTQHLQSAVGGPDRWGRSGSG